MYEIPFYLGLIAVFVAVIGIFFFGGLALIAAIVLIGLAVMAVAAEVDVKRLPHAPEPGRGFRYACPGCGADVYGGQTFCPECGKPLPATNAPIGPGATPP